MVGFVWFLCCLFSLLKTFLQFWSKFFKTRKPVPLKKKNKNLRAIYVRVNLEKLKANVLENLCLPGPVNPSLSPPLQESDIIGMFKTEESCKTDFQHFKKLVQIHS